MYRLEAMNNALEELEDEKEGLECKLLDVNDKIEALELHIGALELEDMNRTYEGSV